MATLTDILVNIGFLTNNVQLGKQTFLQQNYAAQRVKKVAQTQQATSLLTKSKDAAISKLKIEKMIDGSFKVGDDNWAIATRFLSMNQLNNTAHKERFDTS